MLDGSVKAWVNKTDITMKRRLLLSLLVAASTCITALADQIKIEPEFGPYQTGRGGEFTALPIGFSVGGYVAGVTGDLVEKGTFQTFCLEMRENSNTGLYDVTRIQVTQYGGVTLNKGTAWLYEQFRIGQLNSYVYGAGRQTTAAALQNEIWFLMGQIETPDATFDPIVNAAALLGSWNVLDPSTGWLNVGVLNLWAVGQVDTRTGARQDFLVSIVPQIGPIIVPDGGLTLALLGMGLCGLGVVSHRIRN
jgi:hypothetical protein